jgi:hypothetical protein
MSPLDRADAYLTIPPAYGESLGGVRWSHGCDAIERRDGTTVALELQIAQLLEGVFSRPPVPPFALVLHLFQAMRHGPEAASVELDRLWRAYTSAKGSAALVRNAGLLIAELCRGLPAVSTTPAWAEVSAALEARQLYGEHHRPELAEEPPLPRGEFERRVAARIGGFDDDVLHHWLTHGCGPAPDPQKLAEIAETLPVRVAKLLRLARRRSRLAGAAVLAPAVDAAVTIPPRRRTPDALPQGGYCDVTTRGDPERLLPPQFALDPDEFVRRFAGRELLYFKREEPHTAEKPERVIVLAPGVRSWGSVRLARAGAALALLGEDPKRLGRVGLFVTSSPGRIDVTGPDAETIADLLEASDLTHNPGGCLAAALEDPTAEGGPRDVILLTHPRALGEPLVIVVANERRPTDRLFSLAVDEHGRTSFSEWTGGGPVPIRTFRVDLVGAEATRPEPAPARARPAAPETLWAGDVEPVPFPFRPGLVAEPTGFGFDAAGEWVVVAGRDGVLHGLAPGGPPPEVLPRACRDGVVLRHIDAVLGVNDGVVVCGRMRLPSEGYLSTTSLPGGFTIVTPGVPVASASASPAHVEPIPAELFVAAHYDRAGRRVTLHALGPSVGGGRWAVFPELHCVVTPVVADGTRVTGCALDLATLGRFPAPAGSGLVSRAQVAWDRANRGGSPGHPLPILSRWSAAEPKGDGPYICLVENEVRLRRVEPAWAMFEPKRDGKPMLAGTTVHTAHLAGDVLALVVSRPGERKLVLLGGPDGRVLGEVPHDHRTAAVGLSADGRLLARRRGQREVVVSETANPAAAVVVATTASLHNDLFVWMDRSARPVELFIQVGSFLHQFQVTPDARLRHTLVDVKPGLTRRRPSRQPVTYDPARFPHKESVEWGRWQAVLDRLGQVLLFSPAGLLAAFVVRREQAAAWIPGGVLWGNPALIGGPPTPDADLKIGRAIADAEAGG